MRLTTLPSPQCLFPFDAEDMTLFILPTDDPRVEALLKRSRDPTAAPTPAKKKKRRLSTTTSSAFSPPLPSVNFQGWCAQPEELHGTESTGSGKDTLDLMIDQFLNFDEVGMPATGDDASKDACWLPDQLPNDDFTAAVPPGLSGDTSAIFFDAGFESLNEFHDGFDLEDILAKSTAIRDVEGRPGSAAYWSGEEKAPSPRESNARNLIY